MRFQKIVFLAFGVFGACASPETRLRNLQHEYANATPRPARFYWTDERTDRMSLPLPPDAAEMTRIRETAESFSKRLGALAAAELAPEHRRELERFQRLLDSLRQPDLHFLCSAERFCVAPVLSRLADDQLLVFLDTLPAYYEAVQQKWPGVRAGGREAAVDCSIEALDRLDRLEADSGQWPPVRRNRLRAVLPAARHALKDFIARCNSAVLEQQTPAR